jgi:hypothetical protein
MTVTQKKKLIIDESQRYIDNALDILKTKAKPNYVTYEDKKYVRLAGHAAYHAILHAMNEAGLVKLKKGQRHDVKDYVAALAKSNRKMLDYFNACYQAFHIDAGYDGFAAQKTFPTYVGYAKELIQWAATKAAA